MTQTDKGNISHRAHGDHREGKNIGHRRPQTRRRYSFGVASGHRRIKYDFNHEEHEDHEEEKGEREKRKSDDRSIYN